MALQLYLNWLKCRVCRNMLGHPRESLEYSKLSVIANSDEDSVDERLYKKNWRILDIGGVMKLRTLAES